MPAPSPSRPTLATTARWLAFLLHSGTMLAGFVAGTALDVPVLAAGSVAGWILPLVLISVGREEERMIAAAAALDAPAERDGWPEADRV